METIKNFLFFFSVLNVSLRKLDNKIKVNKVFHVSLSFVVF